MRALTVPWASTAAQELVAQFRDLSQPELYRWTVGNALAELPPRSIAMDQLIELATDPKYGVARQMVVDALGSVNDNRVLSALIQLLDDPLVAGHATSGLARLRRAEAKPHLARMLRHRQQWIREEARRGLADLPEE